MGGKVLRRELESYEKAYQKYLGGAKEYNRQSREYNKQIERYNASFVTDLNGNKVVYSPQNQLKAVTAEGKVVNAKLDTSQPVSYTPVQTGPYTTPAIPKDVLTMDVGGGYKAVKAYAADQPGEQPAQPAPIGMQAPDPTKAQLQKMSQPSWSDIERGLIGDVIKTR
jgi:hypothetical protein